MQIAFQKTPSILRDALFTLLFGFLSCILSKVEFQIPGVVNSDLREIPFLICLFYLRNPLFLFVLALFAFYGAPADMPAWAIYIAHLAPLFLAFLSLKVLERFRTSSEIMGIAWVAITVGYYLFALLPLVVVAVSYTPSLTAGVKREFWDAYRSGVPGFRFEIIASSLVTGLYLMQMKARRKLEDANKGLEQIVALRTNELTQAYNELQTVNEELKASHEGVTQLNENLEQLVKERTDKINAQLEQLRRYAYMNAHELRAPLARILGLLQLFGHEQVPGQLKILVNYLRDASTELDAVIRQMNRVLEDEIIIEEEK